MRLATVYARFFRSLNFDFIKRSSPGYKSLPWDSTPDGSYYPFVKLDLDPSITTVVGANEAGKSQVLEAIKFGLGAGSIARKDFCRYSPLFLTDKAIELPEFGVLFDDVKAADLEVIAAAAGGVEIPVAPEKVAIFRMNEAPKLRLYVLAEQQWHVFELKKLAALAKIGMPRFFEIDAATPLPDAVPIDFLATGELGGAFGRDSLRELWDRVQANSGWFASNASVTQNAQHISEMMSKRVEIDDKLRAKYELAEALLIQVAGLRRQDFEELREAIRRGNAGYAKSIVDTINTELSRSLNFRHWWKQDDHFELFVEYQEYDLTFMIRDRTGRTYSFDERSGGLKYFLSYFVQYLSHVAPKDGQSEILLMDEPDAYLSSSGQQDLLRIFEAFAFPDRADVAPIQVVYVTHSPFLIDKNHAERLRVLEKGRNDEGTRVVSNASRNHYEPLRSAIGEFVAETTFIGSCNLILEGASDQVLLAGMSTWLRAGGAPLSQILDLNSITMVPAGSAGHVPYMAFLARGRDVDKPAVIVLLDGDQAGDDAAKRLQKGGPHGKQLVAPEFVLQLSSTRLEGLSIANPTGVKGIEDLVPVGLAVEAVRGYALEYVPEVDLSAFKPDGADIYRSGEDTLSGIAKLAAGHTGQSGFHVDKIGFSRHVCDVVLNGKGSRSDRETLRGNFGIVLRELAEMQRAAVRAESEVRIRDRVNRVRDRFTTDHREQARKEDVLLLIDEVDRQLDASSEAEEVRSAMRKWVREYQLDDDPRSLVGDFAALRSSLESIAYLGVRKAQGESA